MISQGKVSVKRREVDADKLGYFRWGDIGGKIVLTNDAGEWHALERTDFELFLKGDLSSEHDDYQGLLAKGFLRNGLDTARMAAAVRRKKFFLSQGPHLQIFITSLRCNQSCKYCHASRTDMDKVGTDMSIDTAKKGVDLAMQSTSPYICFEFTGGEPTVNMPAIKFVLEYSKEKNKTANKTLEYSVVTNMTFMTEEIAEYLLANDIYVCTSLDGPEDLHNWNRSWAKKGGNAYQHVLKWMAYFNRRYIEMGRDPELWHVDALMTTTRKTFDQWKELVDLYVELGIRNIHIRPLNPFGFASKTWRVIGYSIQEYMELYEQILDYILELNANGVQIMEGTAATILKKILTPDDPNFVDIRSPIGSGTGQIAYSYDGNIYPSDEGRMLAGMGNDFFKIGEVGKTTYSELVNHPTVKTLAVSSLLDALPACHNCWNAPYCGVRPMHNYMNSGDMFGQRPLTPKCFEHMTISKLLFERMLNDESGTVEAVFRRWTILRPRDADDEA